MIKCVIFDYGNVLMRDIRLQREVFTLAQDLRKGGIQTAVLSNMITPMAWAVRLRKDLKDFSPVIISCEVGYKKPKPEIYKIILRQVNCKPQECLFIDDKQENLDTAAGFGIQTLLSVSTDQIINDTRRLLSMR